MKNADHALRASRLHRLADDCRAAAVGVQMGEPDADARLLAALATEMRCHGFHDLADVLLLPCDPRTADGTPWSSRESA